MEQMQLYAGLDVHPTSITGTIKDSEGNSVRVLKVETTPDGVAKLFVRLRKKQIVAVFEASRNWHYYARIKDVIIMAEIARKTKFFEKHQMISQIFKSDERIVGLFGSYAKGTMKKDSDIDIFIVGEKKNEDYAKQAKLYDLNMSIKYFSQKEFKDLLKKKNPLVKEIIENHILFFNIERFIGLLWSEYYGLFRNNL